MTLLERRGEVHVEAIGTLGFDSDDPRPMRRDTIFRISSMTKPITAVAALILVEECRLRLDDPVDDLLPELADRRVLRRPDGPLDDTVPPHRPITLRDLLTFRLGSGMTSRPAPSSPIAVAMAELGLGVGPPRPAADARARRVDAPPRHAAAACTSRASGGCTTSAPTCSAC